MVKTIKTFFSPKKQYFKIEQIFEYFSYFSELMFCNGPIPGILFSVLCLFLNPNVAGAGLVSIITLHLFIKLVGINWDKYKAAYIVYNPILAGMSIGVIFKFTPTVIFIICIITIFTFVLTVSLVEFFKYMQIPILSLPFAIVSTVFYLASTSYSRLFSLMYYNNNPLEAYEKYLPDVLTGFFKAFGAIVFMPNIVVGFMIFIIILFRSRILAFHSVIAFFAGVFIHSLMIDSFDQALSNPYSFNYILIGLTLGGIFLLPSIKTTIICLLAVGVSVILVDVSGGFEKFSNIPIFTLPFNFTVILFVYALRAVSYSDINYHIKLIPEESLSFNRIYKERFHPDEVSLGLPLSLPMTVFQGKKGELTHKDKWENAYDFVITDPNGATGAGTLQDVANQYIFGETIISPVSGHVIICCDTFPDNPPGIVDHINNWGNYIIVGTVSGFCIEISHVMAGSLMVKVGDYVELGQALCKCGNSGFSSLPHIHIQAQKTGLLGDETIPFNFALYKIDNKIHFYGSPEKGDVIEPVSYDFDIIKSLNLNLATHHRYAFFKNGKECGEFVFSVNRMQDSSGIMFLQDESGNRLYFNYYNATFTFHELEGKSSSLLRMLFVALPRLPLINMKQFEWDDFLPIALTGTRFERFMSPITSWLFRSNGCAKGTWRYDNGTITGTIKSGRNVLHTTVEIDQLQGIKNIKIKNLELKKV